MELSMSNASAALWGLIQKTATDQKVGIADDLAFRLARDKETVELIEAIQRAKHQAILGTITHLAQYNGVFTQLSYR